MRIHLNTVLVEDQQKALEFYTRKLGFKKKLDMPLGEYRWLTVVSPQDTDGTELLLEPLHAHFTDHTLIDADRRKGRVHDRRPGDIVEAHKRDITGHAK